VFSSLHGSNAGVSSGVPTALHKCLFRDSDTAASGSNASAMVGMIWYSDVGMLLEQCSFTGNTGYDVSRNSGSTGFIFSDTNLTALDSGATQSGKTLVQPLSAAPAGAFLSAEDANLLQIKQVGLPSELVNTQPALQARVQSRETG
jgi:hypothetical protein